MTSTPRTAIPVLAALVLLGAGGFRAGAADASPEYRCAPAGGPGATLLFPYFRVDLDHPDGANTLIAFGNASEARTIAHVVLWTDWGVPTLAFDVELAARDLQTLSLRDLFRGRFPETGVAPPLFECGLPVSTPILDAAARSALRARHTGLPDGNGDCSGSGLGGPGVATGFVTVDTMNGCTDEGTFPTEAGYFELGGRGLASNENVLWGDFSLVAPREDFAQGFQAVAIEADARRFHDRSGLFYGNVSNQSDRQPLSSRQRVRFVRGGGFDGGTELILFTHPVQSDPRPRECGRPDATRGAFGHMEVSFTFHDEAGEVIAQTRRSLWSLSTQAIELGSEALPVPAQFGYLDVQAERDDEVPVATITPPHPAQAWAAAILRARGRYSVGIESTRFRAGDACEDNRP